MIDSAAIPVKDLILIGETLSLARKTVALQWFIGNISMIIVALVVFGFFLLSNLPITNKEIRDKVVNNKTVFILSGCYLIGLVILQVYLRIFGTILEYMLCSWMCNMVKMGSMVYKEIIKNSHGVDDFKYMHYSDNFIVL